MYPFIVSRANLFQLFIMSDSELNSSNLFPIVTPQGNGYIDTTGKITVKPQFNWVGKFSEGLAAVVIEERIGYINCHGELIIKPQFDRDQEIEGLEYFSEGLAVTSFPDREFDDVQKGYIDRTGKIAIAPQFYQAYPFSEGIARVELLKSNRLHYAYIDRVGKIVFSDPSVCEAGDFSEGLAAVKIEQKWGYINRQGKIAIKPQFMGAQDFSEGLAAVIDVSGRWGYIDRTGNFVIKPRFNHVLEFTTPPGKFSQGLAAVGADNGTRRWGYIDKRGEFAIQPRFDSGYAGCGYFSEGLAWVTVGCEPEKRDLTTGKYGYINQKGKFVIKPIFDFAAEFSGGLAKVQIDDYSVFDRGKWGYINTSGQFVWEWLYIS